jgi:hypothetical protein
MQTLKEFYKGFTFWDWLAIYAVLCIYSQMFALLIVANIWGAIAWAAFGYILWRCHIWSVKYEMRTGRRK